MANGVYWGVPGIFRTWAVSIVSFCSCLAGHGRMPSRGFSVWTAEGRGPYLPVQLDVFCTRPYSPHTVLQPQPTPEPANPREVFPSSWEFQTGLILHIYNLKATFCGDLARPQQLFFTPGQGQQERHRHQAQQSVSFTVVQSSKRAQKEKLSNAPTVTTKDCLQ